MRKRFRYHYIIIAFLFRNHETKLTIFKYFSLQAVVSLQKRADSMILEFIFKHRLVLAHWHCLEDFKYNRHNTYFQKKCICQYLEPSLVSDSLLWRRLVKVCNFLKNFWSFVKTIICFSIHRQGEINYPHFWYNTVLSQSYVFNA